VNKNTIPYDTNKPAIASGIRIGTPAVTTRGMREPEMRRLGELIASTLQHANEEATLKRIAEDVLDLTGRFGVPGIREPVRS